MGVATAALVLGVMGLPSPAHATDPVLPGNESDVGKYTNGANHAMDIGDPVYANVGNVAAQLAPGVPFTAGSMHQSIFDQDLAAGGTDYYLDRILGVSGNIGNAVLMTRGRSLYMRGSSNANFTTMGFGGSAFAGGPNNLGSLYTVTVPGQTVAETGGAAPNNGVDRFNAPSHAKNKFNIGTTGVNAEMTKFITYDNVAVTALKFNNPGAADATFTVRAAAAMATKPGAAPDELTGTRTITSGANNGLVDTPWTKVTVGLKASGFTVNGTSLERSITVPAGGSVSLSVVGALYSASLPDSAEDFQDYAAMTPAEAVKTGVTDFNERWAKDIPYIDVPDPGVEKAIVYRWWGERYNILDPNEPGYVYQYPTTVEGSHLYQNAVALTQPMHLQDTKWIRSPYLPYGQVLNIGELSGSSAFLDSPGHTSWNNHYSQYLGTAGLEAYNVHGGGAEIAHKFATYFENDGIGQLEHYDGNGNNLIAYDTNYMPGNDSDAISFGFPKSNTGSPGWRTIERPESAYVWGDFDAARQLYEIAGADPIKVAAMGAKADAIKDSILANLWSPDMKMFLARTSYGAKSADFGNTASGTNPPPPTANPLPPAARDLIPARESNLYDVYAQDLIPPADHATYVDGFRFLTYGDNFPIFPFYTANQYDKAAYNVGGSNNFSNINFTVQYRAVRSALRYYDPNQKYITPAYAKRLLDWMAWSIYPNADMRIPNQSEYFSNWNPTTKSYNRNNPNHVMLGNMNYIYIEDMGGIQPRSDDKIELWPIDMGNAHFMVNNLRYHGKDITIVWDPDGSKYNLGAGYSLFIDGDKKVSTDTLGKFTYDPNTNTVNADPGVNVTFTAASSSSFPTAKDTAIDDSRVVSYLKTAGIDLESSAPNLVQGATLSSSFTQAGARPTPWRNFHTPGFATNSMNYTPGAISTTERPVSLDAVKDGVTANEPFWGNYGDTAKKGYLELDFGSAAAVDNVQVTFVSDRQAGGYREPARWWVEVPDGAGGWKPVDAQFKSPTIPQPKFNESLFATQNTQTMRIAFENSIGNYTAIAEVKAFDSGRPVPPVTNQAPALTTTRVAGSDGNISTDIVATVADDGVPYLETLTYGWEVVSKPAGAGVIVKDATALSTKVTGTVAGDYVLKFWANDGELESESQITLSLTEKAIIAEFGTSAVITTASTSGHENHQRVNDPDTPSSSSPGAGQGWGNWGTSNTGVSPATEAWIQYTWDSDVRVSSTDIYWYDDNGGVRRPRADTYAIEYWDGTAWVGVTLTNGSTYAGGLATGKYNHFDFETIKTSKMRIRIWGIMTQPAGGAGSGVLRWRTNGDAVESVDSPVIIRTVTGTVPTLPSELGVEFPDGDRDVVEFEWQEITPAMVAATNVDPFIVYGTNAVYGLVAEAQVYVRPEDSAGGISIQGAEQFNVGVVRGATPVLPDKVEVSYNDGSKDNQAIGVDWDFDPSVVDTPGVYTVTGDLVLPTYVSTAGTIQTTLTLTVVATEGTLNPEAPDGQAGWYSSVPTLTLTADFGPTGRTVASTEYRIDGGAWVLYSGPTTLAGEGSHTVDYRSTTDNGIAETPSSLTFKLDTVAPVTSASVAGSVVTLAATDSGSGLANSEYQIDGGAWTAYAGPVTVTGAGTHTVGYRSTDAAGLVEATQTVSVVVPPAPPVDPGTTTDTVAPVLTVTGIAAGAKVPDSRTVKFAWSATDAGSGVASVTATLDGKAIQPGPFKLRSLTLGVHTLVVVATDKAGNQSTTEIRFTTVAKVKALRALVKAFATEKAIKSPVKTKLLAKLVVVEQAIKAKKKPKAVKALKEFIAIAKLVKNAPAKKILVRDAKWLIKRL